MLLEVLVWTVEVILLAKTVNTLLDLEMLFSCIYYACLHLYLFACYLWDVSHIKYVLFTLLHSLVRQ